MATPHTAHGRASLDAREGTLRAEAVLTPEHLTRLLDLSRALAGACEHADLAVIAAERARGLTGASQTQVIGLRDGGAAAVLAEATGTATGSRSDPGGSGTTGPEDDVLRSGEVHTAPSAFVVQYEEIGVDGPVSRFLGVFSSEASARVAVRELDRARSLVIRASISSWTLDAPRPRTSVEVDLHA